MTAPVLLESHIDPHFRSPREYCKHPRTIVVWGRACGVERKVTLCVHCGREVS